jgi:glutaminase
MVTKVKNQNTELTKAEQEDFNNIIEIEYLRLFDSLKKDNEENIFLKDLIFVLTNAGIQKNDPRLSNNRKISTSDQSKLDYEEFKKILKQCQGDLIKKVLKGDLIIPDFKTFCSDIAGIYNFTNTIDSGEIATYIPQLGRVDPNLYAVSVCTVSGQQFSIGNHNENFCIQSICKPINYCMILEEHGEDLVHSHIGREPSGIGFNGLLLNKDNLPHNPMINSGAIMGCSLIKPEMEMADRFEYVINFWDRLVGYKDAVSFNNSVYLSEKESADRNFALGYYMKEKGAFPKNTDLQATLEFYFQCCSIQTNTSNLAIAAATLANSGICPLTDTRVIENNTVKNCLSLMGSCGMYDFSGEFAFTIGLPAKSGVAGGLMLVVPNLMGIAIWSPKLDKSGNTVKGIEFCKELVKHYNFHNYDSLAKNNLNKIDPRLERYQTKIDTGLSLLWAASEGNLHEIQNLYARGVNLNIADYDGRTALHLAASEGKINVVEYLVNKKAEINPCDRWGNTPLQDAIRGNHKEIIKLIENRLTD